MPKIGIVLGDRPYYMKYNNLSYQDNLKIKRFIENKFFKLGCIGTITITDDVRKYI